jgi:hypothetical protein
MRLTRFALHVAKIIACGTTPAHNEAQGDVETIADSVARMQCIEANLESPNAALVKYFRKSALCVTPAAAVFRTCPYRLVRDGVRQRMHERGESSGNIRSSNR